MEKIGIFCSASGSIDPIYFDAAHQIGEWMGKNGKTLIYGGANLGLMECVAKAVKENGGHVIGVVPSKLEENGKVSTYPDEIIATHDLSDRKDIFLQHSDVLVALPGGIGTLEELADTFSHYRIYAAPGSRPPILIANINGIYDPLKALFQNWLRLGFIEKEDLSSIHFCSSLEEIIKILEN